MSGQSKIRIVDYDPEWPRQFEGLRERIWPEVRDVAVGIEHVGSTAVPGMAAKPVIDLDVVVSDRKALTEVTARLERLGYEYQGDLGIADRYAYRSPSQSVPHHLYVCVEGGVSLSNHLSLRDHLRANPADAAAYSELKRRLAMSHGGDVARYTEAKSEFVLGILQRLGFNPAVQDEIRKANQAGKLVREPSTGLTITVGPPNGTEVRSNDVRNFLWDFP